MVFFTSDLHFCHNKEFLYGPRNFTNVEDMNAAIIKNWNDIIRDDDEVYVLGDLMLTDQEKGMECLRQLKGKIHIILGNHDTDNKVELYKTLPSVVEIADALRINIDGYHFFLTHYPCITSDSYQQGKPLKKRLINLYGHTHQQTCFYKNDNPCIYHVGLDSHECKPVSVKEIIFDISLVNDYLNDLNTGFLVPQTNRKDK